MKVRLAWPIVLLCGTLAGCARGADVATLRVQASEPRAFGYQVGDHVRRRVTVQVPAGWTLDQASVPRPGGRGLALELRAVRQRESTVSGGRRIEFELDYQVFLAPAAPRTVEIAPFRLKFDAAARSEEALVEAWPVTVAPLAQVEAPVRRGLGELRPDRPPLPLDTAPLRQRLTAYATAAALLALALAIAYLGPPWRAARNQPFGMAWRRLRGLPAEPSPAQWQQACVQFHEALNRSAGEVLFERGLDGFLARRPGFAPLRDELARFLQMTRAQFFGGAPRHADDGRWLVALCRRCRDAERGLA